jgi:glutaconate CoA-transferase subunit B
VMVVTDRCVFGFDDQTREMVLKKMYPGVKVEEVKALVDWDLAVSPDLEEVEPPTEEQLLAMRTYDSMGLILEKKSARQGESFDDFCRQMKCSYESIRLDF